MIVARLPAPSWIKITEMERAFGGVAPVDDLDGRRKRDTRIERQHKTIGEKRGVERGKGLTADDIGPIEQPRCKRRIVTRDLGGAAQRRAFRQSANLRQAPARNGRSPARCDACRPRRNTVRVPPQRAARGLRLPVGARDGRMGNILQRPQIGETPCLIAARRKTQLLEASECLAALLGKRSRRRESRAIRRCFWFHTHGSSGRSVAEHGVAVFLQLRSAGSYRPT